MSLVNSDLDILRMKIIISIFDIIIIIIIITFFIIIIQGGARNVIPLIVHVTHFY